MRVLMPMSTSVQDDDAVRVDEATDAMDEKEELLECALRLWSSYERFHCGARLDDDEEEEETREAPEEEAARLGTVPRRCMLASGDAEAEVVALLPPPRRSLPDAVERSAYGFAAVREVLRLSARDGRRKLVLRLDTPASSPFVVASDSLSSAMAAAAAAAAAAARRGSGRIPLPAGMPAVEDMAESVVVAAVQVPRCLR